jgi:dolichyl-phosphate beta-glucosyltransferase
VIDDVSVVIPAFNEELRLPSTLDQLIEELPGVCPGAWEIIVSDDGSVDRTAQVALERAGRQVVVISSPQNSGKGAALLAGVRAARHPLVVFLDADLPVAVPTIGMLIERSIDADVVLGSRCLPGAFLDPPQPLGRRLGGRAFRTAISLLGYDTTSDPQCGIKLLRMDRMSSVLNEVTSSGFAFDVELIERARRDGRRVVELPVGWRHVDGSSLRPVRDAARTLGELWRVRSRLPEPARISPPAS